jgi:Resolvase, N terminal domain
MQQTLQWTQSPSGCAVRTLRRVVSSATRGTIWRYPCGVPWDLAAQRQRALSDLRRVRASTSHVYGLCLPTHPGYGNSRSGWQLTGEYVEDVTASGLKQCKEFDRMMLDASQHKFDLLLFWRLDRLRREGDSATLRYWSNSRREGWAGDRFKSPLVGQWQ